MSKSPFEKFGIPQLKKHLPASGKSFFRQVRPPGVLGITGEWIFIFRELGSTGNYFRGAREQAHDFRDIGRRAKKQKKKEKASVLFDFLKISSASGGLALQTPLLNSKCIYFHINMLNYIVQREKCGN